MSQWHSLKNSLPPVGKKIIALYSDGSGAAMFFRHDAAMLALSRLSEQARLSDEMALYYAANRAWHELDAARLKGGK